LRIEHVHHANHFYGHAYVLARYCGLDVEPVPRILGYLQHGWNIGDGLAPGTPYAEGSPIFVWSEQTRRRAWSLGRRNVIVTGAPWIYLLAMEPERPDDPPREGTIWYPFHGWEAQEVQGDHRRLIDQIKDVEEGPVTICLYWQEYHTKKIRRIYEKAGFRIICHGYRGHWWRRTDKNFLYSQLHELRRHKRVASNRVSSALLYGAATGCEPAVYGDPMVLHAEDPTFGGVARIRRQWPELHGTHVNLEMATQIARDELGFDYLMPSDALSELFGWSEMRRRAAEAAGVPSAPVEPPSAQSWVDVQQSGAHR
jgi:hypothetical protein